MKLRVNEIFHSIQGEGTRMGTPAVFVRLSGCNLSCDFCDTKYHRFGFDLELSAVLAAIMEYRDHYGHQHVVITGGEPLLQEDTELLANNLRLRHFFVQLETNGSLPLHHPEYFDWITVSPKIKPLAITSGNELKVIFLGRTVEHWREEYPDFGIYCLQPRSGRNVAETVEYVKTHPAWRLSLQWQRLLSIR